MGMKSVVVIPAHIEQQTVPFVTFWEECILFLKLKVFYHHTFKWNETVTTGKNVDQGIVIESKIISLCKKIRIRKLTVLFNLWAKGVMKRHSMMCPEVAWAVILKQLCDMELPCGIKLHPTQYNLEFFFICQVLRN